MAWRPTASLATLRFRAKKIQQIRDDLIQKGYLEVETPILTPFGHPDPYIDSLKTSCNGQPYYLHTSPEYDMKRLLAAGSGSIFQFARVFRNHEKGRWHVPEFTLLEWYHVGVDHHALMDEVSLFLITHFQDLPLVKMSYLSAFQTYVGIDPHDSDLNTLQHALTQHRLTDILSPTESDRDQYLFLLMSHVVEPALAQLKAPIAIYDFPASQAALSRIIEGKAARFEVYYGGLELANGFYELNCPFEQKKRFERARLQQQIQGKTACKIDYRLLEALSDCPECSGVAIGIDRLLALRIGVKSLNEVIAFTNK